MVEQLAEQLTITLTPAEVGIAGAIALILQLAKTIPALKKIKKWFPYIAVGMAYALASYSGVEDPILPSIIVGLTACGGYDAVKAPTTK